MAEAGKTYAVNEELLTGIANAIRLKTGSDEQMEVSSMPSLIESIPSGGVPFFSKVASGTITVDSDRSIRQNPLIITHGLEKKPLFFMMWQVEDYNESIQTNNVFLMTFRSEISMEPNRDYCATCGVYNKNFNRYDWYTTSPTDVYQTVKDVTDTTLTIQPYTTTQNLFSGFTYRWIALA